MNCAKSHERSENQYCCTTDNSHKCAYGKTDYVFKYEDFSFPSVDPKTFVNHRRVARYFFYNFYSLIVVEDDDLEFS